MSPDTTPDVDTASESEVAVESEARIESGSATEFESACQRDVVEDGAVPTVATGSADRHPVPVRRAIRARAEAVEARELERALARLEGCGGLTAEQRWVVAELAAGVVDGVLAAPESALADENQDPATVDAALSLFGPDR